MHPELSRRRRELLALLSAGITASVAGCAGDDSDDASDDGDDTGTDESDDDDTGNEDEEPEITYELDFSATDIDLTDLDTDSLDEYDHERILNEGVVSTVEYELVKYEDGEETDPDSEALDALTLQYENAEGEDVAIDLLEELENDAYELPTNEIEDGTRLHLEAEIDEETLSARETVNKQIPRHTATVIPDNQEPQEITDSPFRFHLYPEPSQEKHRELRQEYRNQEIGRWKDWIDNNINQLKTDGTYQEQIEEITSNWFEEARDQGEAPSLLAEQLAMTLEYAFQEHLNQEIQAGQIGNNHLEGGTHHTVITRNPETENIWHADTTNVGQRFGEVTKPEEAEVVTNEDRFRSSLNHGNTHNEERGYAETLATAFTRIKGLSDTHDELTHTDEALEEIAALKRTNGNYSTMEDVSRNAVMLAEKYEDRHFQIDVASETPDEEADLEITVTPH